MLKLENSIRGLSFSRVAFDLTIQDIKFLIGLTLVPCVDRFKNDIIKYTCVYSSVG